MTEQGFTSGFAAVRVDAKLIPTTTDNRIVHMAKFKVDDREFDTDNLDSKQKRIVALYQKAVEEESNAVMQLELKRASRIEVGAKLKELLLDK